ncbi:MAG: sigma 54-interacting transcriptional regulator, partial [Spirochaetaceae bacterium]|nr:sigma 54-interacting transcriptional regulator [Spirochaetaceae bacterium]
MFTNKLQLAAEGWNIISKNPEGRVSARKLLLWLAETLEVSSLGINFYNEQTTYSWSEQVDRGSPSLPVPGGAEIWKHPFPSGGSYWLIEGFHGNKEELTIFLNLLAGQWLQVNNMENIETHSHRLLKVPQRSVSDNPSWIAVSRFARNIRSKLPELSLSTRPLLFSGENGCGKKYLATLIHNNSQNPSDPFTGPVSDEKSGTLFIPDWQLICNADRKRYLEDKRRLIAAIIPGEETASLLNQWYKMTGDQRSVIKIPPLREHIEDIPMLAGYFLEQKIKETGLSIPAISSTALEALTAY